MLLGYTGARLVPIGSRVTNSKMPPEFMKPWIWARVNPTGHLVLILQGLLPIWHGLASINLMKSHTVHFVRDLIYILLSRSVMTTLRLEELLDCAQNTSGMMWRMQSSVTPNGPARALPGCVLLGAWCFVAPTLLTSTRRVQEYNEDAIRALLEGLAPWNLRVMWASKRFKVCPKPKSPLCTKRWLRKLRLIVTAMLVTSGCLSFSSKER